jgi:putative transposase
MEQMARNVTMEETGFLTNCRYLLHDRDSKYSPKSPNLNAFAERWVRSVKEECLSKLILFGESSLKRALRHYEMHYHRERNHQGKGNLLLFSSPRQLPSWKRRKIRCRQRLGGLLKYYEREAAWSHVRII